MSSLSAKIVSMTNDPVTRYAAAVILVTAFVGALLVAVHGFWLDPNYKLPPSIAGIIFSGVTVSGTVLGVHVGVMGAVQGGASAASAAVQVVNGGAPAPQAKGGA
jgi:formate hydrogenlyase subunit 3/multisubunit Na+/H+ antiporter MnhD subunit